MKYLEKCPDLKILKFEFKPQFKYDFQYPLFSSVEEGIKCFKLRNVNELHLHGIDPNLQLFDFKIFLKTLGENLPKLQHLCLTCQDLSNFWIQENYVTCEEFASRNDVKIDLLMASQEGNAKFDFSIVPTNDGNLSLNFH